MTETQNNIIIEVKNFVLNNWELGSIHGMPHWQNVEKFGLMLAEQTGANPFVVKLFAYLHDSCRLNDSEDIEHGVRAALLIESLKDSLLKELDAKEFEQLYLACKYHTTQLRMNDETIDTCFDADRLDLPRVGIAPLPHRMATKAGANYVEENSFL